MRKLSLALGALSLGVPGAAFAQTGPATQTPTSAYPNPCAFLTGTLCTGLGKFSPMPTGVLESFQLVAANTPSAPVTVFGGDYILSQTCSGYGTLNLQVRGPDGATFQTIISKTASDTTGGTGLSLGSYAVVQITVSGTTGCNVILARVPA